MLLFKYLLCLRINLSSCLKLEISQSLLTGKSLKIVRIALTIAIRISELWSTSLNKSYKGIQNAWVMNQVQTAKRLNTLINMKLKNFAISILILYALKN